MEELYILSDGSQVDVSNFSEFERTKFFIKNPGAKKQKGAAKSAGVAPKKNQALNKPTDSNLEDGSSGSQKFRLANEQDLELAQKKGIMPPSSTQPRVAVDDYNTLYNLKKNRPEASAGTFTTAPIKLPGQRTAQKFKVIESDADMEDYVKNFRDNAETGELGYNNLYKIQKAKEKIKQLDADIAHPNVYYSSLNQGQDDSFVEDNFNSKELSSLGINTEDFDGFLNKKGYKQDFLTKEEQGLFTGTGDDLATGYNVGLAKELAKKKMLNFYMEEMQRRDITKQDLNQDIEIASGFREKKEIQKNQLFDQNGITKYVEKNFPILTEKLKERDKENAKLYKEAKSGGTDFFSWDTASKIGKAGWNALVDRTNQLSASAYDVVGMDTTAEGIRFMEEENQLLKPDDRGVSYVSGKSVDYAGTKYIVDSKGEIYDADAKIRVTDLFDEKTHDILVENAKFAPSDWMFSTQGAAVQTSGVMADMILQAALTKGVGEFGAIASETRLALNAAKKSSKFTSLLNDTSNLLKAVPLERNVGYSIIAQSTLGYTEGYENTLKAARENGINDKEAFKLASHAGQRMAILYGLTGQINPQTQLVEKLFGSKQIVKNAINQYLKVGEKGFVKYIDNMVKNAPRNLIGFAEEGGKEVIQENIQQMGEIGVNMMTNKDAGKKITNEVMSGDDFINTSILSFISSGLMSKISLPNFNKGTDAEDNLSSLSTLAKNKKEFDNVMQNLVDKKVFTVEQSDKLKEDVDIYYNNVNKLPKVTSAEVAMPVMRELDKIQKLNDQKQNTDKAFHEDIDDQIDDVRDNIKKMYYADQLRVKNKAASDAIKKGVVKNMQMLTFSNKPEMVTYLRENMNMTQEKAEDFASQAGFMMNENNLRHYLKDPSTVVAGQKMIFVNEGVSARQGQTSVGQHEFLHGLIAETIKDDPEAQQLLGKTLADELLKMQKVIDTKGTGESALPKQFIQRFGNYVQKYQGLISQAKQALDANQISQAEYDSKVRVYLGNQWEEALTLYSDAISNGSVQYDEGTFTRLKDIIRQVLQFLGVKNIEFNSGKDVYNFLKDYNKSMESGYFGVAMKKLGTQGAKVNKEALTKELGDNKKVSQASTTTTDETAEVKFALSDKRKTSEEIKKDINKNYNTDTFLKKINNQNDVTLFNILGEYEYIIREKSRKYQNLPDFSQMDFESEVQIALIPHIRNFNKEFLEKREEYKKELIDKGEDPSSEKFKEKVAKKDEEGYQGKKGIVKENKDLNGWINSQLENKIKIALKTGNVTSQKFTDDIDDERFKETRILGDFSGDQGEESEMFGENDEVFDAQQDFEEEQNKLAVLLRDPVFRFTDENGEPINIETVPFGGFFVTEATDPTVAANIKLKKETDPAKREELLKELRDFERGLELQQKDILTPEEKDELKGLRSFKSYDLSTGMMVNTFKALSIEDTPAKIITDEVAREILRSPNVQTLEYRNFKEKLSTLSKTMARRMTFKNGPEIESFLYNNWDLLYKVINHPVDPVTGESSYASKKLPPRLKEFDDKGDLRKVKGITRTQFLQSYYGVDEATRIIKIYGGNDVDSQLREFEPEEKNEKTGNNLVPTAYFDRRTALMELFGDVLVLQEARRLLRNTEFLERIGERNVNLYNQLKDDIVRAAVLQDMAKGKSEEVKFSLAEQENAKYSLFMNGLPLSQQWIVARDIDDAVMAARTATSAETEVIDKLNKKIAKETDPVKLKDLKEQLEEIKKKGKITFKVPSRSKETDKSTAYLIISKVAEGYNDFEFTIKKNADGPLTRQVLEALDFKSKEVQTRMKKNGNLEQTMNEIIEENTGVESSETFSPETAKNLGKNIGRFDLYLPPEDEDFLGLIYKLASAKGDKGEKQIQFFVDNLLKPYSDAMLNLMKARQTMYKDWKTLINVKHKGVTKKLKQDSGYGGYTYDQAVRVYLWKNADYDVPGLDRKDLFQLHDIIRTNKELRDFANDLSLMSKQANGYIEPDSNWGFGSVVGDMNNIISKSNRTKYLEHWQSNVDKIFSKDNLAKIEAVYGRRYVIALKNMLDRMQTGSNRQKGANDGFLNFLNGSTAITMFWNTRSALLQLLGSMNYINTSDNNILMASKAFANQKQYWTDVLTVWNSNYTRDRRSGLMNDVAEAELNQMMNDSRNVSVLDKIKSVKYWILKNGFGATRVMDSLAISLGGATFYRNRIKTYMKQGYSEEDAKKATWRDFYETSEQSQQSADVSKISMNQSSTKGRLLLTFMNTPFQYSRLMKRAASDLVKGRGSVPNNIAKILYYGAIQNAIFNYLQNAMFAQMFGDDDDEDDERLDQQKIRTLNGILDAVIRGSGMIGVMTSAVKNAILKWYEKSGDPKGYGDVMLELANMSPVIGIKFRQLAKAYKAFEYNKEEIMEKGFSVTNTYAIEALTSITSMVQNIPADRVYQKFLNIKGAFNTEYETWQRVALLLGWSEWNLGLIEKESKGSKGLDMNVDVDVDVDVDI